MRKSILAIFSMILTFYSYSTSIYPSIEPNAGQVSIAILGTNETIKISDYVKLKASDFKKLTRKKLSLKQILSLKIIEAKLKRRSRKGSLVDLSLNQNKPGKKPKLWVALLIVLGLTILFLGLAFLIFSGADW